MTTTQYTPRIPYPGCDHTAKDLKQGTYIAATCSAVPCGKCATGCINPEKCTYIDGTEGMRNNCACNTDANQPPCDWCVGWPFGPIED